jgi:hypothetical protein
MPETESEKHILLSGIIFNRCQAMKYFSGIVPRLIKASIYLGISYLALFTGPKPCHGQGCSYYLYREHCSGSTNDCDHKYYDCFSSDSSCSGCSFSDAQSSCWSMGCSTSGSPSCTCGVIITDIVTVSDSISYGITGPGGWFGGSGSLTVNATDTMGHTVAIDGTVGGAGFHCDSAPCVVSLPEGQGAISYTGTCSNGQTASGSDSWKLDITPPTVGGSLSGGTNGSNGWFTAGPVTLTCTGGDALSGLYGISYGAQTANGDGSHTLDCTAEDNAGNATPYSTVVNIDGTPPTATLQCNGGACGGSWYRVPVSISASGSDATSGVSSVLVSDDGGSTWAPSLNLTIDGIYNILGGVVDIAGNPSITSTTIYIDRAAPVSTWTSADGAWVRGTVSFSGNSVDAGSGIAMVYISTDGGSTWTANGSSSSWSYSLDTTGFTDGPYTILVRADDVAGNAGSAAALHFNVDNTSPTITVPNPMMGTDPSKTTFISYDAGSGLAYGRVTISGGAIVTPMVFDYPTLAGTESINWWDDRDGDGNVVPPGIYDVLIEVWDGVGNHSSATAQWIIVTPPAGTNTPMPWPTRTRTSTSTQTKTPTVTVTPTIVSTACTGSECATQTATPTIGGGGVSIGGGIGSGGGTGGMSSGGTGSSTPPKSGGSGSTNNGSGTTSGTTGAGNGAATAAATAALLAAAAAAGVTAKKAIDDSSKVDSTSSGGINGMYAPALGRTVIGNSGGGPGGEDGGTGTGGGGGGTGTSGTGGTSGGGTGSDNSFLDLLNWLKKAGGPSSISNAGANLTTTTNSLNNLLFPNSNPDASPSWSGIQEGMLADAATYPSYPMTPEEYLSSLGEIEPTFGLSPSSLSPENLGVLGQTLSDPLALSSYTGTLGFAAWLAGQMPWIPQTDREFLTELGNGLGSAANITKGLSSLANIDWTDTGKAIQLLGTDAPLLEQFGWFTGIIGGGASFIYNLVQLQTNPAIALNVDPTSRVGVGLQAIGGGFLAVGSGALLTGVGAPVAAVAVPAGLLLMGAGYIVQNRGEIVNGLNAWVKPGGVLDLGAKIVEKLPSYINDTVVKPVIQAVTQNVVKPIVQTVTNIVNSAKSAVQSATTAIVQAPSKVATAVTQAVVKLATPVVQSVVKAAAPVIKAISNIATPVVQTITNLPSQIRETITAVTAPVAKVIAPVIAPIVKAVAPVVTPIVNTVVNNVIKPVQNFIKSIWPW